VISVRHISKSFGTNRVLDDVSLEIAKGEVVCIIGASGSGKSTLLRCMNGLESYDSGELAIGDRVIRKDDRRIHELRTQVGMVFQRFNLFPHRTALRALPRQGPHPRVEPAGGDPEEPEERTDARDFLRRVIHTM
jgi:polar amino acid transport system ATP-binding protein